MAIFCFAREQITEVLPLLAFGFDLVHWNGGTLPSMLDALGLPGCRLWIAPEVSVVLPTAAGAAALGVTIPNNPALASTVVGVQGFAGLQEDQ